MSTSSEASKKKINIPYNRWKNVLIYGIIGGIVVGLYEFLLNSAEDRINIGLGMIGFFLLAPVLFFALKEVKYHYAAGEFFKNALVTSLYVSVIAAVISAIFSFTSFMISSAEGISEMDISTMNVAVNAAFQILVGIVFGSIIGFIMMQGFKTSVPADINIERNN